MPLNPRKLASLLLLPIYIISYSTVYALPYRPETNIRILSTYRYSNEKLPVYSRIWKMDPGVSSDGKYLLKFYPELGRSSIPICRLKIAGEGIIKEIEFEVMKGEREKVTKNGLLIVADFPVPCDIIPVFQGDAAEIYEDRTEAGGRVFLQRYSVTYRGVDFQEAREKDWLRADLPESPGLNMITVFDDKGHEVVKQLWPLDATWWIYEETSIRKSWRIPSSYNVDLENP